MNRRKFLAFSFAASLAAPSLRALAAAPSSALTPTTAGWRRFEIKTQVTLPDTPGPAQLWLPLAQTAGVYQIALDVDWIGGNQTETVHDARYGAPVLRAIWKDKDPAPRTLALSQIIAVRDRTAIETIDAHDHTTLASLLPLTAAERQFWTAPTASVPLDGAVLTTAAQITAGKDAPRERLRAIYDWVIDHTYRDADVPGCGRGDIKGMLEKGQLGGKCADINGLMVGLARADGFPARDVYGIRVAPSKLFPSLGASGDISRAQHCRAEVFLDGAGWFPVDPADVRKVMLADKLPLDSPAVRALRDHLFGNWEMNWVGYNSATDIELPGGDGSHKPDFTFLMYPCAFTSEGNCPCTDPANFRYEITSREFKD